MVAVCFDLCMADINQKFFFGLKFCSDFLQQGSAIYENTSFSDEQKGLLISYKLLPYDRTCEKNYNNVSSTRVLLCLFRDRSPGCN